MENRFHLAIPAGDLDKSIKFYCDVLGCKRGNAEFKYPDAWADINFWGNELTLHATDPGKKMLTKDTMLIWEMSLFRILEFI